MNQAFWCGAHRSLLPIRIVALTSTNHRRQAVRELRLCRERLTRIIHLIEKHGGRMSIRDMVRGFGILEWEIEQAAGQGWIRAGIRKPQIGRPSRFVENVSISPDAKLPPWRHKIPRDFKMSHWFFALEYGKTKAFPLKGRVFPAAVRAYLVTYPNAKSYAAARASASRLMQRPDVQAMIHWFRVKSCKAGSGPCPETLAEFYDAMP